jgi:hypothetical protein
MSEEFDLNRLDYYLEIVDKRLLELDESEPDFDVTHPESIIDSRLRAIAVAGQAFIQIGSVYTNLNALVQHCWSIIVNVDNLRDLGISDRVFFDLFHPCVTARNASIDRLRQLLKQLKDAWAIIWPYITDGTDPVITKLSI